MYCLERDLKNTTITACVSKGYYFMASDKSSLVELMVRGPARRYVMRMDSVRRGMIAIIRLF